MNEENLAGMQEQTEGDSPEMPRRPEELDEKKPEQAEADAEHARDADGEVGADEDDDDEDDDDEGQSECECLAYSYDVYINAMNGEAVIGAKMAQEFRWGAAEGETSGCWEDDEGHIYNRDGDMLWEHKGSLLDYFAGQVADRCQSGYVDIDDVIAVTKEICENGNIDIYDLDEYYDTYQSFVEEEVDVDVDVDDEDEDEDDIDDEPEDLQYLAIQERAMQMLASRRKSDSQDS